MPQQRIQDRRACPADFASAPAGAMLQFEPVRLDLEEAFVAREPFRRVAVGGDGKRALASASIFLIKSCTGA
jgi:hypothetical protein